MRQHFCLASSDGSVNSPRVKQYQNQGSKADGHLCDIQHDYYYYRTNPGPFFSDAVSHTISLDRDTLLEISQIGHRHLSRSKVFLDGLTHFMVEMNLAISRNLRIFVQKC